MRETELRLALICYGGISLAVYMHGITKEVWHLAAASRAFHAGDDVMSSVYRDLLAEIEAECGLRLRVLPDIIAGASAGGINGIFLANALACGRSLDPLTDLWLEQADVEALIDSDAAPSSRLSKLWAMPIAWLAAGNSEAAVAKLDPATRDEVRGKLSHFVRSRWFEPPFSGPGFTTMLLDAFAAMAAGPAGPRLLPDNQPLDLFVTVTDFRGHPERLRLNSPAEIVETEHRLVFGFSDRDGGVLAADAELAFAARATSSFPGAFPPFTVTELDSVLAGRAQSWPERDAFLARMLPRQAAVGQADSALLIDGSVLANAPFRPAIDALAERPARRQIDRRFVYIDPRPGHHFGTRGGGDGAPGFFSTILGAISEIPREQPIRDNLEAIEARSARIAQMRAVVTDIRDEVEARIDATFGKTLLLDWPTPARLAAWRRRAQGAAAKQAGFAFAAYDRLKLARVTDQVAALLHRIGSDATPTRRAMIADAVAQTTATEGEARIAFLRGFDLAFRIRRLRLLARRLSEIEQDRDDPALPATRNAIYEALSGYLEAQRRENYPGLRDTADAIRDDAAPALAAMAEALDLIARDAATDALLAQAFAALGRDARRPLLLAYLGFPFYDVATLPMLQGEGLDEFDPVRVDRIAPDDCPSLREGGAEATLKGIQFNNFGAFFSRAYRENDYLWGRLHGAERLIDITVSTLPAGRALKPGRLTAIKRSAFRAILDQEAARLPLVAGLIAELRDQLR